MPKQAFFGVYRRAGNCGSFRRMSSYSGLKWPDLLGVPQAPSWRHDDQGSGHVLLGNHEDEVFFGDPI
jgi:hypothetical protein